MFHEVYMQRCLELAKKGLGRVSPNPMVGSVVVHNNRIIGEGWHQKAGEAHAEVNAINSVQNLDLLKDSTIYVNLEPCAHFGKTPPCSDLIIEKQIPRVVIGCRDSFSEVDGKGIERLRNAGVEVILGILEHESIELNRRFFTYYSKNRPYILLKWAQTQDGFIDKNRNDEKIGPNWISSEETKVLVHRWRSEEDAILVGPQTVINDNPSLTVREVNGPNPTRLILDRNSRVPASSRVFDDQSQSHWFKFKPKDEHSLNVILNDYDSAIEELLAFCYENNIQSLIVEGGAGIHSEFIKKGLWDEARVLIGATKFKSGLAAPRIEIEAQSIQSFGADQINIYRNL